MKHLVVFAVLASMPAAAVDFAFDVGALEVIAVPISHAGFYPYLGASVAVPVAERLTFVGALSFEFSFDQGRGGFVGLVSLDYLLSEHVGVDLNVALIHDQPGLRFAESVFFLGGGPGVSLFFGKWAVSPYFSVFTGLGAGGLSLVPGVNVARTF